MYSTILPGLVHSYAAASSASATSGFTLQVVVSDPGSGPALTGGRPQSLSSCASLPNRTAGGSSPFLWSVPEVDAALRSRSAFPAETEEASTAPPYDEYLVSLSAIPTGAEEAASAPP